LLLLKKWQRKFNFPMSSHLMMNTFIFLDQVLKRKVNFLQSSRGSLNIMEGEKNPTIRQFGEMLNLNNLF
jgi:hypothetical protein